MLSNSSQVILRNSDYFQHQNVLILNYEADTLGLSLLAHAKSVTALALDFNHHLQLSEKHNPNLACFFGHTLPSSFAGKTFDCVIIYFPKAKTLAPYLFEIAANHLAIDGQLVIVGDNKGGIKSVAKLTPECFSAPVKRDNARHCLLYTCQLEQQARGFKLENWLSRYSLSTPQGEISICNLVGVFSEKRLDLGTELLLSHLPKLNGRVLDFGCGAGVITVALLKAMPELKLECIDINAMALASCELTLQANHMQAKVYPSDGLAQVTGTFDAIISNPPFHDGLTSTTDIATQFVTMSAINLKSNGIFQIVANRHLPYADTIAQAFGAFDVPAENNKFKLYACHKK
ncbi:methyltransferase [Shewanella sp. SR44-3]|uniref:methyltransferase n=1 Tax=unclassified Shewanella TaxID=196818 RepID=UPI0015F791A5|nr:methyltransferase [Shewanella sp. SR44-3]MBB1268884.1 methyltransferase [Shewanella sp. SR44-3]